MQNQRIYHLNVLNKYKYKEFKWTASGIIKFIQYRDNVYKKRKTNPSSIQFAIHKINFDTYNNIL